VRAPDSPVATRPPGPSRPGATAPRQGQRHQPSGTAALLARSGPGSNPHSRHRRTVQAWRELRDHGQADGRRRGRLIDCSRASPTVCSAYNGIELSASACRRCGRCAGSGQYRSRNCVRGAGRDDERRRAAAVALRGPPPSPTPSRNSAAIRSLPALASAPATCRKRERRTRAADQQAHPVRRPGPFPCSRSHRSQTLANRCRPGCRT